MAVRPLPVCWRWLIAGFAPAAMFVALAYDGCRPGIAIDAIAGEIDESFG